MSRGVTGQAESLPPRLGGGSSLFGCYGGPAEAEPGES